MVVYKQQHADQQHESSIHNFFYFGFYIELVFLVCLEDMTVRKKGHGNEGKTKTWKRERSRLLCNVDLLVIWIGSHLLSICNLFFFGSFSLLFDTLFHLFRRVFKFRWLFCLRFFLLHIFILRSSIKRFYIWFWIHKMLKKF